MVISPPSRAATAERYTAIGGIGSVQCVAVTNGIAEARQRWGLDTPDAWNALNGYIQYTFGFMTAYNAMADGIYDIAAGVRGAALPTAVRTIADSYCRDNPTSAFDMAMWGMISKLTPSASRGPN